jgi:hypothetical protein
MHVNGRRQNIDELLARMEAVRGRLDEDAQAAKQTVHELSDWRSVVRKHPLMAVGLAAAAGFLLVPRKRPAPTFSKQDLEQLARENKIVITQERQKSAGLVGTFAAVAGAALTRAATSYVSTKLSDFAANANREGQRL